MESSRYNAQPFNRILQNNPQRYEYHKLIESNNFTNNDLETHYITLSENLEKLKGEIGDS